METGRRKPLKTLDFSLTLRLKASLVRPVKPVARPAAVNEDRDASKADNIKVAKPHTNATR